MLAPDKRIIRALREGGRRGRESGVSRVEESRGVRG
jgi:hypothetical protein